MKKLVYLLFLSLLVMTPSAFATDHCSSYQFCGALTQLHANGPSTIAGSNFSVHFCPGRDGGGACVSGSVNCPIDGSSCMYQAGSLVVGCTYPEQTWYVSAFNNDASWGEPWTSIATVTTPANCPTRVFTIGVPPHPGTPVLEIPREGQLAQAQTNKMTVYFDNNAIDADRDTPSWPVTYVIYEKYWPSFTNEPSAYNEIWRGTCNGTTSCSVPDLINISQTGEYRVKVDVLLDVSASVAPSLAPVVYKNSSHGNHFSVGPGSRCLGCGPR
jgi:hypothetical protein